MQHLDEELSIMDEHSLFAKELKCEFGLTEILYLRHVISADKVMVHQEKIQTILDWPPPRNVSSIFALITRGLLDAYLRQQLPSPISHGKGHSGGPMIQR